MKQTDGSSSCQAAAAHVRRLLARMQAPHAALRHILQEPEHHIASLTPRLTVLEATPFGTLPDISVEPVQSETAAPARASQRFGQLQPAATPVRAHPAATEHTSPTRARTAVAHGGQERALPVIPAGAGVGAERLAGAAPRALPVAAGIAVDELAAGPARAVPERGALSTGEQEETADVPLASLGALVERVRRQLEAAGRAGPAAGGPAALQASANAVHAAAPATSSTTQPRTTVLHLRPAARPGVREGAALTAGGGHGVPIRNPAQATPPVSATPPYSNNVPGAAPRSSPVFFFNPLDADRPDHADDDALAERIAEVLREQARRQGIDPT